MNDVHVFISSVSAEFGSYRDELRHLLERPNVSVKIQEDFIAAGTVTLDKLDTYIASCEAVVHLVGDRTGSPANAESLGWIQRHYPHLADRYPVLSEVLAGTVPASYTQWEAYLALWHNKVLLIAKPTANALRDVEPLQEEGAERAQCQQQEAHLERLRLLGYYPEIHFPNAARLAAEVALSRLYDLSVAAGIKAAGMIAALRLVKPRNLPYESLGSLFKGRDPWLRRLRKKLMAPAGATRKALHGLGGIGKTRLAVEYAWQHQEHYTALLFVTADSPAALETNLAALCHPVVLNLPEYSAQEQELRLAAALRWLQQHPGWLLILDNLDTREAAMAAKKLLVQLSGGHVLLTTRLSEWGAQVECLELDVLAKKDAARFLLDRTASHRRSQQTDATDALDLAHDLGQLALALEQAGAYIDTKRITLSAYRAGWATNQNDVWEWVDEHLTGYPRSVAVTWKTSFDQLSAPARTLLHRLAWLAADPVPRALLEVAVPEMEVLDTEEALTDLARYSLAAYAANASAFRIHRLVQEVTRDQLTGESQRQRFSEALRWMNEAFKGNPDDVRTWQLLDPLLPHAVELVTHSPEFGDPLPTSLLLTKLGQLFKAKARLAEAEPLMRRALRSDEDSYGPEHPQVAVSMSNLAGLLCATNCLPEAELLYRRALQINEDSYGPKHPQVAVSLSNLALMPQPKNGLAEAEPLMRRALRIDEDSYGPEHPQVAVSMSNLAGLLCVMNRLPEAELLHRLDEAELLYRRALWIDENRYGPNDPEVAVSQGRLALLLQDTNRLHEAESLHRRALRIDEDSYGPDHPEVAVSLSNLAGLLCATNCLAEAELLYRRSLIIYSTFKQRTGYPHPQSQREGSNYVALLRQMGQSSNEIKCMLAPFGLELRDT